MKRFAQTEKQVEILEALLAAADAGGDLEFHALRADLSYGPDVSPQALQSSIRYLEEHGLVRRKYGKRRKLYLAPTLLTYQMLRPDPGVSILGNPSPRL